MALKPAAIDGWIADRFAFRGQLIRWHNITKYSAFGVSPTPELERGPEGWIFTTEGRAIDAHRGLAPLQTRDLQQWADMLEQRRAWLAARGSRFAVLVAPGKPALYPEQLPPAIRRAERTPLDQFIEAMSERDLCVIDVRSDLERARADDREDGWLYYPYGTHWTDRGNLVAYQSMMRQLAKCFPEFAADFEPMSTDEFAPGASVRSEDHWGGRLRMQDLLPQDSVFLRPRKRARAQSRSDPDQPGQPLLERQDAPELPRALLVHDSYGHGVRPLLAEHCSRLRSSGDLQLDLELAELERPDLVLMVMVERKLLTLRLTPLEAGSVTQGFERARRTLFDLSRPDDRSGLKARGDASLTPLEGSEHEGAIELHSRAQGQGINLPELGADGSADWWIRVALNSPKATELVALYKTAEYDTYTYRRAARAPIVPGSNEVWLHLDARGLTGSVLLVVLKRGKYTLRELEIRAD